MCPFGEQMRAVKLPIRRDQVNVEILRSPQEVKLRMIPMAIFLHAGA